MSQAIKKFPFLRLPFLAMQQVVRKMELQTILFLSLTSTKAKNILKIMFPKNYVRMNFGIFGDGDSQIILDAPFPKRLLLLLEDSWNQVNAEDSFKFQNVDFNYFILDAQKKIELKWGGTLEEGTKALMTHLAQTFNSPKIELDFHPTIQPNVASALLRHAKILNLPLMTIRLETEQTPVEVYREFLKEGPRITQSLSIFSESATDFTYSPGSPSNFRLDFFSVRDAHWVHLDDFMECRQIVVFSTQLNPNMYCLNSQRLNEFFKLWKRSECRLERLEVFCSRTIAADIPLPNFEQMTEGLDGTNFTRTDNYQSLGIERQDGKRAKIKFNRFHVALHLIK